MSWLKRWLLLTVLLGLGVETSQAQTHVTAPGGRVVSEWWYEPADAGWGLIITHSGANSVVLYTGFDANGQDEWSVGVGPRNSNVYRADLIRTRWDPIARRVIEQRAFGRVELDYIDAETARLRLTRNGNTTEHALKRVIASRESSVDDYSGLWLNPGQPGFGMSLLTQGQVLAVLATAYDQAGEPRWWLGYKLTRPNDPAPFTAKRFRRVCNLGCAVIDSPAGEISITPKHERDLSAKLRLLAGFEPNETPQFIDHASYRNLGEPASGRTRISDARPFHSQAAIEDYLGQMRLGTDAPELGCLDFSAPPPGQVGGDNPQGSVTNAQEPGVDEADALARSDDLVVVKSERVTGNFIGLRPAFRLYRVGADSARVQELTLPPSIVAELPQSAMVLPKQDGRNRFLLVSMNQTNFWIWCGWPSPTHSRLTWISVGAAGDVRIEHKLQLAMAVLSVRRVQEQLLINATASLLVFGNAGQVQGEINRPYWQLDSLSPQSFLVPQGLYLSGFAPGKVGSNLVSVLRIPIERPEQLQSFSMIQDNAILYAGTEAAYVVSPRHEPTAFSESNVATAFRPVTNIQKLRIADFTHRGGIDVAGGLSATESSSYQLSEWQGDLRVLTEIHGHNSDGIATMAQLTVVRESASGDHLIELSHLPNPMRPQPIGAIGERLHGTRFLGARAFAVTFRQIDPLYSIRLDNPLDPRIESELSVTGFSDHLQVLGGDRLLGFGREVDPDRPIGEQIRGLKLSLFDYSSDGLIEQQRSEFGGAWSWSPLLLSARALTYLPRPNGEAWMATPMRLNSLQYPYPQSHWAVLRMRFDPISKRLSGISELVVDRPMDQFSGNEWDSARSMIYGDQLYLFLGGRVYGLPFGSPATVIPELAR